MPSRKQRRREAKAKRHEYEFVYVDAEGNELDEVPEELEQPQRERAASRNGAKAATKRPQPQQRGRRVPPVPSWNRAFKRAGLLGIVVFVLFSFTAKGNVINVVPLALLYTALFVPFTYYIDRFAYRRWQAREGQGAAGPGPPRKR
jgi:hypothetical protein